MRKATKFNRNMMLGMMAMAVVLLAVVFGMYYWSMRNVQEKKAAAEKATSGDTITLVIDGPAPASTQGEESPLPVPPREK